MPEQTLSVASIDRSFKRTLEGATSDFLALKDVTFDVKEGEFVSIVGPSGCGKSTLLKIIAGLLPPSNGAVNHYAKHSGNTPHLGFVFQDAVLLPWKTAWENALFALDIMGIRGTEETDRVRRLFSLAGLQGFEDSYPKQLSGGMRQRVSIVRALAYDPPVLLMDEPFGALDAITRDSMNNVLLDVWRSTRKTVVFVTHSIAEAVYLSDRVLVMGTNPGRVIGERAIPLERPRNDDQRLSAEFYELVRELKGMLG